MSTVRNIFIVDDDDIFVFLTKRMIKATERPAAIKEFSDGEQVLDFLKDNIDDITAMPDVMFLDISMPVMDGWEFLRQFSPMAASIKKKIALYVVSSSISPHDMEKTKQFPIVTDFVIKPLAREKFIGILDKLSLKEF